MKVKDLAYHLNVSNTAVYNIVNGQSMPSRDRFTRIREILCHTAEEHAQLIEGYAGVKTDSTEINTAIDPENYPGAHAEAKQFLLDRASAAKLRAGVQDVLSSCKLKYRLDAHTSDVAVDFLVQLGKRKLALECRNAKGLDLPLHREVLIAKQLVGCRFADRVAIVIPDGDGFEHMRREVLEVVTVSHLSTWLKNHHPDF